MEYDLTCGKATERLHMLDAIYKAENSQCLILRHYGSRLSKTLPRSAPWNSMINQEWLKQVGKVVYTEETADWGNYADEEEYPDLDKDDESGSSAVDTGNT